MEIVEAIFEGLLGMFGVLAELVLEHGYIRLLFLIPFTAALFVFIHILGLMGFF